MGIIAEKVKGMEKEIKKLREEVTTLNKFMAAVLEIAPQTEEIKSVEFTVEKLNQLVIEAEFECNMDCVKCDFAQQAACWLKAKSILSGGKENATKKAQKK